MKKADEVIQRVVNAKNKNILYFIVFFEYLVYNTFNNYVKRIDIDR